MSQTCVFARTELWGCELYGEIYSACVLNCPQDSWIKKKKEIRYKEGGDMLPLIHLPLVQTD